MSIENGRWTPGIGDPTIMGWVTVAIYFGAALLCFWAVLKTSIKQETSIPGNGKALKLFWICLALILVFLGFNKQLDLQSLLTQIGKDIAVEQGWYNKRREVQFLFVIFIGVGGTIILSFLMYKYWKMPGYIKTTLIGCVILFVFIMIRAMSFHHVDIFLKAKLVGIKMNWLFEIGGLSVILLGTISYLCSLKNKKALQ